MNTTPVVKFTPFARVLHWTMAVLILGMLFVGVGMVASLSPYHRLLKAHEAIGILILVLAATRLIYRLLHPAPPLPAEMPRGLRTSRTCPITCCISSCSLNRCWAGPRCQRDSIRCRSISHRSCRSTWSCTPRCDMRMGILGLLFFATILAHFAAALMHALIYRDGVFGSMAGSTD